MAESGESVSDRRRPPPLEVSATPKASVTVKAVQLRIFTKDKTLVRLLDCPMGRLTSAKEVLSGVLASLDIPKENADVFSLWMVSKQLSILLCWMLCWMVDHIHFLFNTVELQLKPYHLPCKIYKRWKDLLSQYTNASYEEVCSVSDQHMARLVLQRNAFYPVRKENLLRNDETVNLLYHEAVERVTSGLYPDLDFNMLAGIQAAIEEAEPATDGTPPRKELGAYYPPHMLIQKGTLGKMFRLKDDGLKEMFREYLELARSRNPSGDITEWKIQYLEICRTKPFYGSAMFQGQIERPFSPVHVVKYSDKPVMVAINTEHVNIIDTAGTPLVMLSLHYDQLSWELEPALEEGENFYSSLWLEFDTFTADACKRLQVFSRQAPLMNAMISRCVEEQQSSEASRTEGTDGTDGGDSVDFGGRRRQESSIREQKLYQCRHVTYHANGGAVQGGIISLPRFTGRQKMKRAMKKIAALERMQEGAARSSGPQPEGSGIRGEHGRGTVGTTPRGTLDTAV